MSERKVTYAGSLGLLTGPKAPDDIIVLANEPKPTEDQIIDLTGSSTTYDRPPIHKAPDFIDYLPDTEKPKPEEIIDLTK